MPQRSYSAPRENTVQAENIVFDKANEFARLEANRDELQAKIQQLKESKSADIDMDLTVEQLAHAEKILQELKTQKD